MPKKPNLSKIPANRIDPSVEASTCASGNHMCRGITGILTASGKKKKNHKIFFKYGDSSMY
jgi:hypothetical protein